MFCEKKLYLTRGELYGNRKDSQSDFLDVKYLVKLFSGVDYIELSMLGILFLCKPF